MACQANPAANKGCQQELLLATPGVTKASPSNPYCSSQKSTTSLYPSTVSTLSFLEGGRTNEQINTFGNFRCSPHSFRNPKRGERDESATVNVCVGALAGKLNQYQKRESRRKAAFDGAHRKKVSLDFTRRRRSSVNKSYLNGVTCDRCR